MSLYPVLLTRRRRENAVIVPDIAFNFLPFTIYYGSLGNFTVGTFDLRSHANITVSTEYYLDTVSGDDGNAGTRALPKKTWNHIMGLGDADRVTILDGSYLLRSESSLTPGRSLEIIGEGDVYLTGDRVDSLGAWSKTDDQTNVYQSNTAEFIARVFDDGNLNTYGNPVRYLAQESIAAVDANEGSFYLFGGTLYIYQIDGGDPTGNTDLCFYDNVACYWPMDNVTLYFQNINFRSGVVFLNATVSGGLRVYLNRCTAHTIAVTGADEFGIQDSVIFSPHGDGINYDILNGVTPNIFEIGLDSGEGGSGATDQASTIHNGISIVRINGNYHDMTGATITDAGAGAVWCVGARMSNSVISSAYVTDNCSVWLDTCDLNGNLEEGGSGEILLHSSIVTGSQSGNIGVY